jgi:hypothetical protein
MMDVRAHRQCLRGGMVVAVPRRLIPASALKLRLLLGLYAAWFSVQPS